MKCLRGLPVLVMILIGAGAALAQDASSVPAVPAVPTGDATLRGVVVHVGPTGGVADLEVVLYSLASDGRPGVSRAQTSADGQFAFERIASSADIVYLLAVRYGEIPFGQRVVFEAGELEREVRIEVSEPVPQATGLSIAETRIFVEPAGNGVRVRVSHRLMSTGERVAYVDENLRVTAEPVFTAWLPAAATDFQSAMMSLGDGLERRGERVLYWGPLYPGDQEIQYEFSLAASDRTLAVAERMGAPTRSLLLTLAKDGSALTSEQLAPAPDIEVDGRGFLAYSASDLSAGESLRWSLELPDFRSEPDAITFSDATLWLELDDTNLVVNEELELEVAAGASLLARDAAFLFELELPPGAELTGVSPALSAIGAEPTESGIGVRGPVSAGTTKLAFRYRLASTPEGVELSLRFPRELAVLRLFVADTGVAIGSDRLHRRRPFRSGTRMYLHNEAFQVKPGESVGVTLKPIRRSELPGAFAVATMGALGLLSMLAVLLPLRGGALAQRGAASEDEAATRLQRIYAAIRDLDHDFETGKLAEEDYHETRLSLKAEAVLLLKQQRESESGSDSARDGDRNGDGDGDGDGDRGPVVGAASAAARGAFCTQCGRPLDLAWRFCSACGSPLDPARGDE